jgi:hypothetical protein
VSVEDNTRNFEICRCLTCPSFRNIEGEGLYCARGRSLSTIERKGCLCLGCPVLEIYHLTGDYFCDGKTQTLDNVESENTQ